MRTAVLLIAATLMQTTLWAQIPVNRTQVMMQKATATWCGPCGGYGWTLQEQLNELVEMASKLLAPKESFFVLSMYAVGLSAVVGWNVVKTHFPIQEAEHGEFFLKSKQGKDLPMGTFLRFRN